MTLYRADLHIHTCLSPCGSLDMSPTVIVETALARGLDIIAITDHNSTLQCCEIQALGAEAGLTVFAGAEVCTREEAHCLALFGTEDSRAAFQEYLDRYLPPVPNDPERFGDQVWVNRNDEIMGEAPDFCTRSKSKSGSCLCQKAGRTLYCGARGAAFF